MPRPTSCRTTMNKKLACLRRWSSRSQSSWARSRILSATNIVDKHGKDSATVPVKSGKEKGHERINHERSAEINDHGDQRDDEWCGHGKDEVLSGCDTFVTDKLAFGQSEAINSLPIIRMTRHFKLLLCSH